MSRVRTSPFPGGWRDEGPQEHVSRAAKNTIGGAMVTEQPFYPFARVHTPAEAEYLRKRREQRAASS